MSHEQDGRQRDWYMVSVETLRGLGWFVFLLGCAVAGFFGYQRWERYALEREAGALIDEAAALRQQLAEEENPSQFALAVADLEEAQVLLAAGDLRGSIGRARRSRDLLLALLDAHRNRRESGEAQFLAVQGDVDYRRGERGAWDAARSRVSLRSGDYVKTGANGSAEIMFVDGTLYTVRPNTLFLVSSSQADGSGRGERTIELRYGWVNLNTAQGGSEVATPQARAHVADASEAVVSYDQESQEGRFTTYDGTMEVSAGGEVRRLQGLATVAQRGTELGETEPLPAPPELLGPEDNATVDLAEGEMRLDWGPVGGSEGYALQVSRSRLFVDNVIEDPARSADAARLRVQGEGSFVWRVAALGSGGVRGPWSETRRFRVGSVRGGEKADEEPPELAVDNIQSFGTIFIVDGRTEPGAAVWVNGEPVAVGADGAFTKTVQIIQPGWSVVEVRASDAWGNEMTRRRRVLVEGI